jgi:hypothetical protein
MAQSAAATQPLPDFWDLLRKYVARLDEEAAKVTSDSEMNALVKKWRGPNGVLDEIRADPLFSRAKPSAQRIFVDVISNRIGQVEQEWNIWRSLFE